MKPLGLSRFIRAYRMVFGVSASYLWLAVRQAVFGRERMRDQRELCHRKNAVRIERTVLELKGLFIKVGQTLSIMTNFLPEPLTRGLEGLQDAVPPHPYDAIRERIIEEFHQGPEDIYASFEKEPIASASIGQVHRATLKDGTDVAVKIQYPEIDRIVSIDLRVMKRIFWILHLFFPSYGLKEVFLEIEEMLYQELDYKFEGKNLEKIRDNFVDETDFLFPEVYWEQSSSKVLTLRYMEGIKITDTKKLLEKGIDLRELATVLIHGYCKQIFEDGVYHADPHPGNLMVRPGEAGDFQIILIDFGAIATINDEMKQGITQFAEGLIRKDTRLLANSLRRMGFVARENEEEAFDRLVDYFYSKLANLKIENFRQMDLSNFQNIEDIIELKKLNVSFRDLMSSFRVPRDWVLLERTLLLSLGITTHLDPKLNPVEIILPYVEQFVLKDRSLAEVIMDMLKDVGLSYIKLPHEIEKALSALNRSELAIRNPDLARQTKRLYALGHQFLYAILGFGVLGMGYWWQVHDNGELARYHYYGTGVFGILLLVSFFKNRR
jgi:ubiquinone biosynthesis protein